MNITAFSQKKQSLNTLYLLMLITAASIPFSGLNIQLGGTFNLSNILTIISAFILGRDFLFVKIRKDIPYSFYSVRKALGVFLIITCLGNLTFLLDPPSKEAENYFNLMFDSGGFSVFRTALKPFQAFISSAINLIWILIPILTIKSKKQILYFAYLYVISSAFQASLGIFQYIYYLISGINFFPIYRGGLIGNNIYTQDAFIVVSGVKMLRINAMSGEPKGLALILCFGIAASIFLLYSNINKNHRMVLVFMLIAQIIALIFTFSTLGYVAILVLFFVWIVAELPKFIALFSIAIASLIIAYIFGDFSFVQGDTLLNKVFEARFSDRLQEGFEDMDLVYINFIVKNPSYLFLGTGFGTFHLASFEQASQIISWRFGIILPKLGIFSILATSGCAGMLVFMHILLSLKSGFDKIIVLNIQDLKFIERAKKMLIYIFLTGLAIRYTIFALMWVGIGFAIVENYDLSINKQQVGAGSQYEG
jgi:hypothetical protein